jgi:hypothetical protein
MRIKIYRTTILAAFYGYKTSSLTLREAHRLWKYSRRGR